MAQDHVLTIGLCGQVSAGKTSFMNTLCNGFVGDVSLARATTSAELIQLRIGADDNHLKDYEKEMLESKTNIYKWRRSNDDSVLIIRQPNKPLRSLIGIDLNIIDFPGISSLNDTYLEVLKQYINRLDLLFYITSIETAFNSETEIELFNEIKFIANKNCIQLIILINKMDNPYDIEHNHLIKYVIPKEIKEQNKIYRISCHKMFIHYLKLNKIKRTFMHNDILNELSKIFKSADVLVDTDMQNSITSGNLIDFSNIKYNNSINEEDYKDNSGDYDRLINFIIYSDSYKNDNLFVTVSRCWRRLKRYVIDLITSN